MTRTIWQALITILALFLHSCGFADICAVRDLGLVPNDPSVDNGAILSDAIKARSITDTIHFPGGAYYATSAVDDAAKAGLCFEGQGLAPWMTAAGEFRHPQRGPQRLGDSSVRWIYTGRSDQPAFRFQGYGHRIEGFNIWRGYKGDETTGGTAIEFSRRDIGPPAGKHHFSVYSVAGFDVGVHFRRSKNHVDCMTFEHGRMNGCRVSFLCDNDQTTTLEFRGLWIEGKGETVFDFTGGGNVLVSTLGLIEPRLVLKADLTSNTARFEIQNFKVDNNAAGWRLIQSSGPLSFTCRGYMGNKALPAQNAVEVRDYMERKQHVDIELRHGAQSWEGPDNPSSPAQAE